MALKLFKFQDQFKINFQKQFKFKIDRFILIKLTQFGNTGPIRKVFIRWEI